MTRLDEIKKRLSRWQEELPKLVQPERSYIQNISDVEWLIEQVEKMKVALEVIKENGAIAPRNCDTIVAELCLADLERSGDETR